VGRFEGTAERSQRLSYEGAGMSVSNCPEAWRQIARGQVAGRDFSIGSQC
jgi:hypothetical protein